jgi:tetratricopeptide (TPR) repeat protein
MSQDPTPPAAAPVKPTPWRQWLLLAMLALILAAAGGAVYLFLDWRATSRAAYQEATAKLNDRGVALMEQFKYEEAAGVFEEVVHRASDWMPGRINLGIALMNLGGGSNEKAAAALKRSQEVFREILSEKAENPYAHFCLGIMAKHNADSTEAIQHFDAVLQHDPHDPHTLCWLAALLPEEDERKVDFTREALKMQPAFSAALFQLQQHLIRTAAYTKDPEKRKELQRQAKGLSDRLEALKRTGTAALHGMKYTEMGRYAEVLGSKPQKNGIESGQFPAFTRQDIQVNLAPGARWATAADLGEDAVGRLRAKIRGRFGGTIVVLDYNRDDKPDLFLAGAVVENGKVRDLLLRNDGAGKFTDVTAVAGLANPHPTLGATAADFDNDGRVDLLLTGVGSQRLFRNKGDGTFADVSEKAGLDKVTSVCLGSAFIDLEQDSDLDIVLAQYAATAAEALEVLDGTKPGRGEFLVFLNKGDPLPAPRNTNAALTCRFERSDLLVSTRDTGHPAVGIAASDVDSDNDLDLLLLSERARPDLLINDRLLQFRNSKALASLTHAAPWNGALVLDADHDRRSDVFLIASGQPPVLLLNRASITETQPSRWFDSGTVHSPSLLHAVAADVDLDTWTDVVGLSADHIPVLLHNEGGKLMLAPEAFGPDNAWPKDLVAVTMADVDGRGWLDLITWSETQGIQVHRNEGNGNRAIRLTLVGSRWTYLHEPMFMNEDAIGAWVWAQSGKHWAGQELTTLAAGLAQSRQPLLLSVGNATGADTVHLRWPDGCWQAELDVPADRLTRIADINRKPGSCPLLFTWNGERWVFITDFLGAGSVGELGPDRTCRPPRPEESVKIEPGLLAPKDGRYLLSITEPMNEVTYLDKVQLVAIDHPAGVRVFPDERFTSSGPPASQDLIAFDREIFPQSARDHRGRDVTDALRRWDRATADGFWRRGWIGFAEDHFVELDFGDRLAEFGGKDRLYLCLAGWIDYPFPESIWAAHQAGVEVRFPVLERQDEQGRWVSLGDAGFPAGLPRMMLVDVTGKLTGPRCLLRLRTNLQIYWDQAFIAAGCRTVVPGGKGEVQARVLDVHQADLGPCGIQKEYSPDGRKPTIYDHDHEEQPLLSPPAGRRTRFGEVTELLREKDDCFVVFGPGDELKVQFDAAALPPVPRGWQRSFVLKTWGYCKDSGTFTAKGATIEPLPFAAMRNYPPTSKDQAPQGEKHREYLHRYQTREVNGPR